MEPSFFTRRNGYYEVLEWRKCSPPVSIIAMAIAEARKEGVVVKFTLHKVTINVAGNSQEEVILRDYQRARKGYIEPNISPYPGDIPPQTQLEKANIDRERENNCPWARYPF